MMLSLVQTSQNRRQELIRFINSLNNQISIDLSQIQLIFIDQGDNLDLFGKLNPQIKFDYIKYHLCSLSHARNIGLCHVTGEFIGFPDDDCWYESDTLCRVLEYLKDGTYQGITGMGTDENGKLTSVFPNQAAQLTITNRCAAISYTVFFKFDKNIKFDEDMGVGSPFNIGAGEETDYLLSLMEQRMYKVFYDPAISIHHPTNDIYDKSSVLRKSYSYARGAGYLIKKHRFPLLYILKQYVRPFGGIIVNFFKMDMFSCKKSFLILKGRIEGYNWKRP